MTMSKVTQRQCDEEYPSNLSMVNRLRQAMGKTKMLESSEEWIRGRTAIQLSITEGLKLFRQDPRKGWVEVPSSHLWIAHALPDNQTFLFGVRKATAIKS